MLKPSAAGVRRNILAAAIASAFALGSPGSLAAAGMPLGPEFRVSTRSSEDGFPQQGDVAVASDGRFAVSWTAFSNDPGGGGSFNIFARVFAADGTALAPEFQVNTRFIESQGQSQIAMAADGSFTIVWIDSGANYADPSVQARRFGPDGSPRGGQFQVSAPGLFTVNDGIYSLSLAISASGAAVVVWEKATFSGVDLARFSTSSFRARRIDAAGRLGSVEMVVGGRSGFELVPTALGGPAVSTASDGPSVAMDDDGDFVVAWAGSTSAGTLGGFYSPIPFPSSGLSTRTILFRRVSALNLPDLLPTVVETVTTTGGYNDAGNTVYYARPAVAMDPDGDFVVAYSSGQGAGPLVARRYSARGRPVGAAIPVDTGPFFRSIGLALAPTGQFTVAWTGFTLPPDAPDPNLDIYARVVSASNAPLTGRIRVNGTTVGEQSGPAVAVDGSGNFVVNWTTIIPSGSPGLFMPDLLARRFSGY